MAAAPDQALTFLRGTRPTRRAKAGSVITTGQEIFETYQRAKVWYNNHTRWTVSINSNDRLYDIAHRWFLTDDIDSAPPRALNARFANKNGRRRSALDYLEMDHGGSDMQPGVELYYDERGNRDVTIAGHKVTVSMTKPDAMPQSDQGYRPAQPDTIYFHARSKDGQQAVVDMLENLAADQEKRKPALHLLTTWGDWSRRDDLPERQLSSVVLAEGQMERIRDDIQSFLSQESDYVRRGMPYHRGYLLYGPPGTGKTSIVRALAAHFGLDLWYAPLGDLQKDSSLMSLINQVRPGSILLLEDIDVFHATRTREDEAGGLSMAGLLNGLDGVATPHGLITFMTTNDVSVIDEALLRPGRVDLREEIGLPKTEQIARLIESWYGTKLDAVTARTIKFNGTTADVTEILKRNLNDQAGAVRDLQKKKPIAE